MLKYGIEWDHELKCFLELFWIVYFFFIILSLFLSFI